MNDKQSLQTSKPQRALTHVASDRGRPSKGMRAQVGDMHTPPHALDAETAAMR